MIQCFSFRPIWIRSSKVDVQGPGGGGVKSTQQNASFVGGRKLISITPPHICCPI